ncbi:hypothetical protein AJ80_07494 [Polytolypa hystricis UAMH7299]|uniref:Uncharacterized protein n=1 Tax=Polytolypa hystricis (strain UAMH7299) TaxID=1447883 RepID=A0A2B7XPK8_POLH7|nr:hypothetical protein AJ80_07494 [Polytolypa hystricis UAMH7299]
MTVNVYSNPRECCDALHGSIQKPIPPLILSMRLPPHDAFEILEPPQEAPPSPPPIRPGNLSGPLGFLQMIEELMQQAGMRFPLEYAVSWRVRSVKETPPKFSVARALRAFLYKFLIAATRLRWHVDDSEQKRTPNRGTPDSRKSLVVKRRNGYEFEFEVA